MCSNMILRCLLWACMHLYSVCTCLDLFGPIGSCMVLQDCMTLHGSAWSCCVLLYTVQYGYIWFCLVRSCIVLYCLIRICTVQYDPVLLVV